MSNVTPTIWQTRVMTAFEAYWDPLNPTIQIMSPNRPFDRAKIPATVESFIEWAMQGSPDGQTQHSNSVANNHFQREGFWVFTANVRVHLDSGIALDLLDQIGLFFEAAVIQDGYFHALGTPLALGDDGAWYQVSLSSEWLYFTDRSSTLT